jgi:hypothetical protein
LKCLFARFLNSFDTSFAGRLLAQPNHLCYSRGQSSSGKN